MSYKKALSACAPIITIALALSSTAFAEEVGKEVRNRRELLLVTRKLRELRLSADWKRRLGLLRVQPEPHGRPSRGLRWIRQYKDQ